MPRAYGTTNAAPYAAAPAVGASGDTYFNTTSKLMYLSDGTQWIAIQSGGSGATFDGFTRTHASATGATDTTMAIPGATYTDIPLALAIDALGSTYTPNGTNTRFAVPADGVYDLSAHISAAAAGWPAASGLWWAITVNGLVLERTYTNGGQAYESSVIALQRYLRAGDLVAIMVYSGTATTIRVLGASGAYGATSDARQPYLSVWRAGTGPTGPTGPAGGLLGTTGYYYGYATGFGVAAGSLTPITWNTQGVISGFTPALGGSGVAITATIAGRYKVDAQITIANGATATAYFVCRLEHYNAVGTLLAQRDVVGPGVAASAYSEADVSGVFNMAVGDYVRALFQPAQAANLDARTWIEVTPVGGAKGDTGATGPDVTAAQSSWFYAQGNTGQNLPANTFTTILWGAPFLNNGFTFTNGAAEVYFTRAGKYRVAAQLTFSASGSPTASTCRVVHYNSTGTILRDQWVTGQGATAGWGAAESELIADAAVGDFVRVFCDPSGVTAATFANTRSALEITPVGGVKGDTGATGATGAAGAGAGTGFVARGEWSNAVAYNPMEVVTKNGVAFLAMAGSTNVDPGSLPAGSFTAVSDLQASIAAIGKILTWTPVFRQGVALAVNVASAWYARIGEWVIGEFNLAFASSGTAGQSLQMDLPVPLRNVTGGGGAQTIGEAFFYAGANQYPTMLAPSVNYTQFAIGTAYYTTQVLNSHNMSGFFMYPAPVGV